MPTFLKHNQNRIYESTKEYRKDHNIIGSRTWNLMDLIAPPSNSTRYFPAFFAVGAMMALLMGSMRKFGGIFTPELAFVVLLIILIGMRIHDALMYRAAVKYGNFAVEQEQRLQKYTDDQLSEMSLDKYSEIHGEPEDDYISAIYELANVSIVLGIPSLWFIYMFLK